ncbi:MAG: hypothetical protein ABEI97_00320 [Candidatus Nanohaloarchaea archaeon]
MSGTPDYHRQTVVFEYRDGGDAERIEMQPGHNLVHTGDDGASRAAPTQEHAAALYDQARDRVAAEPGMGIAGPAGELELVSVEVYDAEGRRESYAVWPVDERPAWVDAQLRAVDAGDAILDRLDAAQPAK